jgi:cardiolipin synthase (CMP-forming)
MTVPNILTLARILLTPLLVWLLLDGDLQLALLVFLIAGLTDGLDGMIARLFDQKTKLGAYLDPLADKILLVSSFILLAHLQVIPVWLVIIAVSRDVIILLGIMTLMFHDIAFDIKPSGVSKATTLLQLATVLAAMSSTLFKLPIPVYWALYLFTAGFSIASGIHYLLKGVSLLEGRKA